MKSPFPGMDPFIEACGLWEGFQGHLIDKSAETLASVLPERYLVRAGERSYIVMVEPEGKVKRPFLPDVSITGTRGRKKNHKTKGGTALAEFTLPISSVTMLAFVEEEHRETFVEIYDAAPGQRLVTSIEVLSPTNKRPDTPGWDLYQRKRQSCLPGAVNLVEIDLVRSGQRMPMVDLWPESAYAILVARSNKAPLCEVWPIQLPQPIPPILVPLAKPDTDVELNLQPLIDTIYQHYRYERSIDYARPLSPALSREEATWVAKQIRNGKLSR
jgi:hypothetical protein